MKIAHTADLHINANCKNLEEISEIRKSEIKNSLYRVLKICSEENVDILLIAGDLFDNSADVPKNISDEIKIMFSKMEFKIFISPGNHDPFTVNSVYDSIWPENVFIFKSAKISQFTFSKQKLRVFGAAFNGTYQNENMLETLGLVLKKKLLDIKNDDFINIGVVHADFYSKYYNPITSENIANSGFDYLALGHIHKHTQIQKIENTYTAYSGCPEGAGFDECGEKGIYIGQISKNFCSLKFKRTCKRKNEILDINISTFNNDLEISQEILKILENKFGNDYTKNIFKIILNGEVSENCLIDARNIEILLKDKLFFVKVKDKTTIYVDVDKLRLKKDLKGMFIKNMVDKIQRSTSPDDSEIEKLGLKLGLKAFSEEVKFYDFE